MSSGLRGHHPVRVGIKKQPFQKELPTNDNLFSSRRRVRNPLDPHFNVEKCCHRRSSQRDKERTTSVKALFVPKEISNIEAGAEG